MKVNYDIVEAWMRERWTIERCPLCSEPGLEVMGDVLRIDQLEQDTDDGTLVAGRSVSLALKISCPTCATMWLLDLARVPGSVEL